MSRPWPQETDTQFLRYGLDMTPELTSRSSGAGFVCASLDFADGQWRVLRFRMNVVAFNRRALKVSRTRALGFVPDGRIPHAAPELGRRHVVEWTRMEAAAEELGRPGRVSEGRESQESTDGQGCDANVRASSV